MESLRDLLKRRTNFNLKKSLGNLLGIKRIFIIKVVKKQKGNTKIALNWDAFLVIYINYIYLKRSI